MVIDIYIEAEAGHTKVLISYEGKGIKHAAVGRLVGSLLDIAQF